MMKANSFNIFSTWNPRPETAETMGRRMLTNLDALADISPYFGDWWFVDHRVRITDLIERGVEDIHVDPLPLDEMRERMTKLAEYGVRRDDNGNPEPIGGYTISALNDLGSSPISVSLDARGGGGVNPPVGLRSAEFRTSDNVAPDPEIVCYPLFKSVLKSVVSAWDVRHAQAYSNALRWFWNKPYKLCLDLAWMTYLSPPLVRRIALPSDAIVERSDDGGLILIAAEETFDTSNPKHMAAAESIRKALAPINAKED